MKWTLFGAGNFISDICDAIYANGDTLASIVINQDLSTKVRSQIPSAVPVIPVKIFEPNADRYFFGFIDPHKDEFLKILKPHQLNYANLIHPRAYLAHEVILGMGNFVGAGAVIGPQSRLGNFNIVNRLSSLGHDVRVADGNHFGPGCTISGRCKIGKNNFFGAGSTVIDGLKIENNVLLGAGAVMVDGPKVEGVYVGVPAKLIK